MTIHYDFDEIIDRQESDCVKWHYFDKGVLPMWVADMDFRSPEPVIRALQERVRHGVYGYPELSTHNTDLICHLKDRIVERMASRYRWFISEDDIFLLPGVVTGFNLACHALAVPDKAVYVQTPVYHPILHAGKETGCLSQEMELTYEPTQGYSVDLDLFKSNLNPQTRLFILCNPHNPVGKVFRKNELLEVAEICLERGITICSDEIHCDLIFSGHEHIPIASLDPAIARNTITLMAPSKTFNLAGLQCSFAIVQNSELRQTFLNARKGLVPWVNLFGLQAALAAYAEGGEWFTQLMVYLEANRDYLVSFVQENLPGVRMIAPEGTYLAWLDCREAGIEGSPYQFFLEEARVGFNDGEVFGKGGGGFVRMNFGCPRALLVEGLERMKHALEKIQ
jgi:cystathionine beta-lyase